MLSGVVGWAFLATSAALAADMSALSRPAAPSYDPAVSALNSKIEGYGGSFANKTLYGAAGSLTAPVGAQYGAQIDGNLGSFDGSAFGSVGGHWFWRNPNQALLGIYGAWTGWDRFGGVNEAMWGAKANTILDNSPCRGLPASSSEIRHHRHRLWYRRSSLSPPSTALISRRGSST
jgi:hypothetical protein